MLRQRFHGMCYNNNSFAGMNDTPPTKSSSESDKTPSAEFQFNCAWCFVYGLAAICTKGAYKPWATEVYTCIRCHYEIKEYMGCEN